MLYKFLFLLNLYLNLLIIFFENLIVEDETMDVNAKTALNNLKNGDS
jgi:hypothetical protein